MLADIIKSIKAENYDEKFLYLVQSLFCSKHKINEYEYKAVLGEYNLNNIYNIVEILDESFNLHELVFNFDSYLDKDTRSETGSYYTPPELAEAMVKRCFADYFIKNNIISKSKCELLIFSSEDTLSHAEREDLIKELSDASIIDISSGSGIFLFKTLIMLVELYNTLCFEFDLIKLSRNLFAIDLQSKPLEIYLLIVYDYLLDNGFGIEQLPKLNVSCQDTLIDEIPFDRKFDIVIGNPPYVGEKGNKELFDKYKKFDHLSKYYEGRMDLFYFFIYRGHEVLSDKGLLSYITTNYFITADGANKLRKYLKDNTYFYRLINFDECKLFSEAKGMHNLIFTLSNTRINNVDIQYINKSKKEFDEVDIFNSKYKIQSDMIFSENDNIIIYESKDYFSIIEKMIEKSKYRLEEIASINQGIVSGADKVTKNMIDKKFTKESISSNNIIEGEAIFVHDENSTICSKYFKPFYKNSDIDNYFVSEYTDKKILYLNDLDDIDETDLEWKYLNRFYDVLSKRREVDRGTRKWYSLQWGRDESIFEGEKIIAPQRSMKNKFAYSAKLFYSSADVYYITKSKLEMKYLLALLNSKLMYFWLYNRGKRKGKSLELYAKPISQIPIAVMNDEKTNELINYIDEIIDGVIDTRNSIDELIYTYYNITCDEKILIEKLYDSK